MIGAARSPLFALDEENNEADDGSENDHADDRTDKGPEEVGGRVVGCDRVSLPG